MAKLIIGNSVLTETVRKASVSLKDSFVLKVTAQKDAEGNNLASLCACDGSTQANITFLCKCDSDEAFQVIIGKEFANTVKAVAQYAPEQDIVIDVKEGSAQISCGEAKVPLGILADAVEIQPENPQTEKVVLIAAKSEDLKKAVSVGGMAYSTSVDGRMEVVKNAISLSFVTDGETNQMQIVTTNGLFCAGAHCPVSVMQGEGLAEKSYSLKATVFTKIASELTADAVQMFLFEKQVIVRENNDFYIIVPNANKFPSVIGTQLFSGIESGFTARVNRKKLAAAIEVAMLNASTQEEARKTVYSLEGDTLKVHSFNGKSETKMGVANASGAVSIGLNGDYVKSAIAKLGEEVTISGTFADRPVFLNDGTAGVALMLAPFALNQDSSKEE